MMLYQPGKSASSMILLDQRQGDRLSGVSPLCPGFRKRKYVIKGL